MDDRLEATEAMLSRAQDTLNRTIARGGTPRQFRRAGRKVGEAAAAYHMERAPPIEARRKPDLAHYIDVLMPEMMENVAAELRAEGVGELHIAAFKVGFSKGVFRPVLAMAAKIDAASDAL